MKEACREWIRSACAWIPGGLEGQALAKERLMPWPEMARPGRAFRSWARLLESPARGGQQEERILILAVYPFWVQICLAIGVVLAARGRRVDIAYLPHATFDREDYRYETRAMHYTFWRYLRGFSASGLRLFDLSELSSPSLTEDAQEVCDRQSVIDTKYVLRREEIDPLENPADRQVYEFRRRRNAECMSALTAVLERSNYARVLIPNGSVMEFGVAFEAACARGLKVATFEFGERIGSVTIAEGHQACRLDTHALWEAAAPHRLSEEARCRIQAWMASREGTDYSSYSYRFRPARRVGGARTLQTLGVDGARPVGLMFTNLPWDTSWLGQDLAFASMVDWVRRCVSFFAARRDATLLVRLHPSEQFLGHGLSISDILRSHFPTLPSHIRVIRPADLVSTYDLMEACDFGLVYCSTTGLEMALRGIPTAVGSRPHYGGKGFTRDARTAAEYFATVERLLGSGRRPRMEPTERELAWCYADLYYYHWQTSFPWHLESFWRDVVRHPLSRIVRENGEGPYRAAFERLEGKR